MYYLQSAYTLTILMTFFRFPLVHLGGPNLMRLPSVLLILFSVFLIIRRPKSLISSVHKNKAFYILAGLSVLSPLSFLVINGTLIDLGLIKKFLSTIFIYSVVPTALILSFSKDQIFEIIDTVCVTTVLLGASLWIFESNTDTLGFYFREFHRTFYLGEGYTNNLLARYGFQGDPANSLGAIIVSSAWCFSRFFEGAKKNSPIFIYATILSLVASIHGESILSIMVHLFILAFISFSKLEIINKKPLFLFIAGLILTPAFIYHPYNLLAVLLITFFLGVTLKMMKKMNVVTFGLLSFSLLTSIAISYSAIPYRIYLYFTKDSHLLKLFIPDFSGCSMKTITQNTFSPSCHFAEFHFFKLWENSNIYVMVCAVSFLLLTIFHIIKMYKASNELRVSSFILAFSLIVISTHYSPITAWGGNILFAFGLTTLLFNYDEEQTA